MKLRHMLLLPAMLSADAAWSSVDKRASSFAVDSARSEGEQSRQRKRQILEIMDKAIARAEARLGMIGVYMGTNADYTEPLTLQPRILWNLDVERALGNPPKANARTPWGMIAMESQANGALDFADALPASYTHGQVKGDIYEAYKPGDLPLGSGHEKVWRVLSNCAGRIRVQRVLLR